MVNGKDSSPKTKKIVECASRLLNEVNNIFPISSTHYIETARITDPGRRKRLAEVMWSYSHGQTIAPHSKIIKKELYHAFSQFFNIKAGIEFNLIGYGIYHAFGMPYESKFPKHIEDIIEKSILTGDGPNGEKMPAFRQDKWRISFLNHLKNLPSIRNELPRNKWEDCLYAISMTDIIEPIGEIMLAEGISPNQLGELGKENIRKFIDLMPTRQMDVFLHKLVLQNPSLKHKITDLDDWAGVGVATQYCDLVICEKHFHNFATRKGFKGKAVVSRTLEDLLKI